jgi:hypothetical protein
MVEKQEYRKREKYFREKVKEKNVRLFPYLLSYLPANQIIFHKHK